MKLSRLALLIPCLALLLAAAALVAWLRAVDVLDLQPRIPGRDRAMTSTVDRQQPLVGTLTPGPGRPANLAGDWSRFRGPRFDAIAHDTVPLARSWPAAGPPVLWSLDLGEGYAGAAVRGGRVYVLDYDARRAADVLRCLSLADGREIWQYSYPVTIKRFHGMSRTVPAVTDKYVVTLGPKCQIACLDPQSGKAYWLKDLVRDFGATIPQWYAGQCPMIDGDLAIFAPGGDDALLVALDCRSGDVVWRTSNPRRWKMTHSSIMPMQFAGRKMYVYFGKGGVAGVSADDGTLLWDTTAWKVGIATCPSPVILPEGRIFCCGGYNSGAVMLQLVEENGTLAAKELFRLTPRQFGSTQHTPVFYNNHLFGVREHDKQLVCLDLDGKEVWRSGADHRFAEGRGPYFLADGLLFLLDDNGKLTLVEATTAGYHPLARAQVLHGHDAWAPMALADGRLLLRDLTQMLCLNVAQS
ncbi:MAG TPA: PQQ-binding-like beta-propeller repeat protein, partial [Thermoguttaceae bacterium]|nr:PQQ-binding-like beta-propeller repeat protein [Thermoguttaceae bacterium]